MMDQGTAGQLLLCCLGVGADGREVPTLIQLSQDGWERLIQQATRHGVASFVYKRFISMGPCTNIPTWVMQRLREISLRTALQNLRLYHELSEVLRALQQEAIPVIVLKGAFLAEIVYGERWLRPMVDVDLLVRSADLSRVETKLLEAGFSPLKLPSLRVEYEAHHHLHPFMKSGELRIEVHSAIERPSIPFNIDTDELWKRAQPAIIGGVNALALSPEDLLLHLCLHASFTHKFRLGLRSVYDISETLRHYGDAIDWEQVSRRAGEWRIEKYVYLTLRLTQELMEVTVPEEALSLLRPNGFDPQVIVWARGQIFAEENADLSLPPNLAQLWGSKRLREKAALVLKRVFPSPEVMARMYPVSIDSNRIYLYYPTRWKDLLTEYGHLAWRLVRRDKTTMDKARQENQKTALRNWLASVT